MFLPIPPSLLGPDGGAFRSSHGDSIDAIMWAFSIFFVMALLFLILVVIVSVIHSDADAARGLGPGQAPFTEQLPLGGTFRNALRRLFGSPATVADSAG